MTRQFFKYVLVGLLSNLVCYAIYLILTMFGMGHKFSMTMVYMLGVSQTFVVNKRWTFNYKGRGDWIFYRYCFAYGAGYVLNLLGLTFFVDMGGFRHDVVQACMIFVVAIFLFLLQKFWIFRNKNTNMEVNDENSF